MLYYTTTNIIDDEFVSNVHIIKKLHIFYFYKYQYNRI